MTINAFHEMEPVLERYKDEKGSLITILQKAQEIYGYLPKELIVHISERTGIKPARIMGVVSFYTQFRLNKAGKFMVMLCQGTACHVNGSKGIEAAILEELGIEEGETTEDGLFTVENVACLGCCSLSPVMMINGEAYGLLTPEKAKEIVRDIKSKQ